MTTLRSMALFAALSVLFCHRADAGLIGDGNRDPRFSTDGDVTTFFDLGGGNTDTAPTVVIDASDRIITFAEVSLDTGIGIGMSRHLADGTPDSTLGAGGKKLLTLPLSNTLRDPKALRGADGKIYLLVREDIDDSNYDWALCRLFVAGNADPAFSTDGCVEVVFNLVGGGRDYPTALAFDAQGRIVVGGYAQTTGGFRAAVARVNGENGVLDGSFGPGGKNTYAFSGVTSSRLLDLAVLDDSRIAFVGAARRLNANELDIVVGRITISGALDPSYFGGGGFRTFGFDLAGVDSIFSNDEAYALELEPRTGAMLLAGRAQASSTRNNGVVVRLSAIGQFDNSFGGDGTLLFGFAGSRGGWFTDLKTDGRSRVYAYGQAEENNNDYDLVITRLNADGFVDSSFSGGRVFHNIGPAGRTNLATELHFVAGKPLLVGSSLLANQDYDLNLTRLWSDLIFADSVR